MVAVCAMVAFSSTAVMASGDAPKAWKKCKACHKIGKHAVGPNLSGIVGKKAGSTDFGKYKALKGADITWDEANLTAWLTDSKAFAKDKLGGKKTSMGVKTKSADDVKALIEYLKGL